MTDSTEAAVERILVPVTTAIVHASGWKLTEAEHDAHEAKIEATIRAELEAAYQRGVNTHKLPPITCCGHEGKHEWQGPMFGCEYHGCTEEQAQ